MGDLIPAEVFPPGEFIKDELDERGWTQTDLATILDRPLKVVNEIIAGKKAITPETARGLGEAFGTGATIWMNLESAYRLSLAEQESGSVSRRAAIYNRAPISEMVRRKWIQQTNDVAVLEDQYKTFYGVRSPEDEPSLAMAARKSTTYASHTPAQIAWGCRARQLARAVSAQEFNPSKFTGQMAAIRGLAANPEDARRVPAFLAGIGVRFLIVEHLSKTKIDGACFWLDPKSPVVVMSIRFDRMDNFWQSLIHELIHVKRGDGKDVVHIDEDICGDDERPESEKKIDSEAAAFLIPPEEMDGFYPRIRPLFYAEKIRAFAAKVGVHPAIVVGQLHHRGMPWSHHRKLLVRVRDIVTGAALTDGWGQAIKMIGATKECNGATENRKNVH